MNRFIVFPITILLILVSMHSSGWGGHTSQGTAVNVQTGDESQIGTPAGKPQAKTPFNDDYFVRPFNWGFDPFEEVMRLQSKIQRLLDENPWVRQGAFGLRKDDQGRAIMTPAMDVAETDQEMVIVFDLPGIDKELLQVEVKEQVLTVTGVREKTGENIYEEKGYQYRVRERNFESFQRSLKLPNNVDVTDVQAKYENGILTVRLPKIEEENQIIKVAIQ